MIRFRCWYCNKSYTVKDNRCAERLTCTCEHPLRVPRRSGGNCRVKTLVDWLVEMVIYGFGGAFLGLGLALLILSRLWLFPGWYVQVGFLAALTSAGFLIGLFGGERGINWVGRVIRDHER